MKTYNSNITGLNAYFYSKREDLETLMDQEDPYTIWLKLSYADNHWLDLHELLYSHNSKFPDLNDPVQNIQWKHKMDFRYFTRTPEGCRSRFA